MWPSGTRRSLEGQALSTFPSTITLAAKWAGQGEGVWGRGA